VSGEHVPCKTRWRSVLSYSFHKTVYTRNKAKQQTQLDNLFYLIIYVCVLHKMLQFPLIGEHNLCVHWRWATGPRTPPKSATSSRMKICQAKQVRNRAFAEARY